MGLSVWHHVTWEFEGNLDVHTYFIAVTVDGVRFPVNRYYRPQPSNAHELNVAFQINGNKEMVNYHVWADKISLPIW